MLAQTHPDRGLAACIFFLAMKSSERIEGCISTLFCYGAISHCLLVEPAFAHLNAFAVEKCDDLSHVRAVEGVFGEFFYTLDGCSG
jgi:hypothetical protein